MYTKHVTLLYPCFSIGVIIKTVKTIIRLVTEHEDVEVPIMQLTQFIFIVFIFYLI